ncbi:WD40 repeat-like protein [Aphelenchoides avenae]|nr:WD40 repeat-like protein [Aphelenchus avenae]
MKAFTSEATKGVSGLLITKDGNLLTAYADGHLTLWRPNPQGDDCSFQVLRTYVGHTDGVLAMCLLDDAKFLTASKDDTLRVWSFASSTQEKALTQGSQVCSVPFAGAGWIVRVRDGLVAVSGGCTHLVFGHVDIWDVNRGVALHVEKALTFRPHAMQLATCKGFLIVLPRFRGKLSVWNVTADECEEVDAVDAGPGILGVSPCGYIYAGCREFNCYSLSNDGKLQFLKTIQNPNYIWEVVPITAYDVLIVDAQCGNSGRMKLYNQFTEDYRCLGDSHTSAGLAGWHSLLPRTNFLLAIADDAICYQHVKDIDKFEKPVAEIRKNARLLAQAQRTAAQGIGGLPKEILLKIASLTATVDDGKRAKTIAMDHFCRPYAI